MGKKKAVTPAKNHVENLDSIAFMFVDKKFFQSSVIMKDENKRYSLASKTIGSKNNSSSKLLRAQKKRLLT
jgi:hypothetical protein